MNTTPTATTNLPISLLVCPGRTLQVPSPFPPAKVTFVGWGGIRGMDHWNDAPGGRSEACREMLVGVSRHATVPKDHRIVIGCERRTAWMKDHHERGKPIDALLHAIYYGMKAVHGHDTEVAFSGPEDAVCGDFTTPMLGYAAAWNPIWNDRNPMPFISPRYGGTANSTAEVVGLMASKCGLSRGVILWMQETEPAAQQAVIEFGLAVDQEYGRIK